jgi:hypothetical protein
MFCGFITRPVQIEIVRTGVPLDRPGAGSGRAATHSSPSLKLRFCPFWIASSTFGLLAMTRGGSVLPAVMRGAWGLLSMPARPNYSRHCDPSTGSGQALRRSRRGSNPDHPVGRWAGRPSSGLLRRPGGLLLRNFRQPTLSPSVGRDQTRSAFRWYAVDRGLGLRHATTCHITTDRNHTRKRALKAPLRTLVFTAWSLHKERTQPAPLWQVSLLRTGSGDPGVLAMNLVCPADQLLAR